MPDRNSYDAYLEASHQEDPELRADYVALGPRFEAIREVLRAREARGMTQRQLAEATGTSRSVISRLESGRHSPTVDTLAVIANALGYRLETRFVVIEPVPDLP